MLTITLRADSGTTTIEVPPEWAEVEDRDRVLTDAIAEHNFPPSDLVAYRLFGALPAGLEGLAIEWPEQVLVESVSGDL